MTNATLPTSVNLTLLNGQIKFSVDQSTAIKPLLDNQNGTNGTQYSPLKDITGTSYVVPAATNLRFWGVDNVTLTPNGTNFTVFQLGYDDDGAGTNFVSLFDIFAKYGGATVNVSNIITGLLTVPTGKHVVVKNTNSGASSTVSLTITGLLTA